MTMTKKRIEKIQKQFGNMIEFDKEKNILRMISPDCCKGRVAFTVEALEDIETYYNIKPEWLFTRAMFICDKFKGDFEVDITITDLQTEGKSFYIKFVHRAENDNQKDRVFEHYVLPLM